ncbi:hypothetical protein BDZ85DRAFT_210397 [Elsinoe ampelina]|uniref:Six-hairpin glycosidase-like protein n=1 Tax=Elsinoe ampelina TaxID=302913 RepID=A0A6A6GQM7_9PEZI|nr:hypothetical protein BDZ85DRAFT_210397 [Elsinoe ampelina]
MAQPQVSYVNTTLKKNSFLDRKRQIVWEHTLLHQLELLKKTGRYDAFRLQWHPSYSDPPDHWPVPNHLFWDSDVGKWIEAACYFLHDRKNSVIEDAIHELVEMIRSAQKEDGYLNIHFSVVAPEERFTNLEHLHELYNAGHLIEAAVAHHQVFKNDRLLEPLVKYVKLIAAKIGPETGKLHGYPGHPEIEIALIRLHQVTKNPEHLALAQYFIEERGAIRDGKHFFAAEAEARGWHPFQRPSYYPKPQSFWYNQSHKTILEQDSVEGHSVRAMYLLTAVAALDKYRVERKQEYRDALVRLWDNMVSKKMYINGGVGAIADWEGFSIDYFLPQGTDEGGCYAETCAAIGVMMLAERMLQIDLNGKYSDIMELCLFNSVLCCMSTDGKRFTYVNQLASSEGKPARFEPWFTCACCPPSLSRTLGFLTGYLRTTNVDHDANTAHISVHIPAAGTTTLKVNNETVTLDIDSDYPLSGTINFTLHSPSSVSTTLAIRIPPWASSNFTISPLPIPLRQETSYLHLPPSYLLSTPTFTLTLPMRPRFLAPHPATTTARRTLALARGPMVYCLEDVDNTWVCDHFRSLRLDAGRARVRFVGQRGGAGGAQGEEEDEEEEVAVAPNGERVRELTFVPFYFRGNREGRGQMRVGIGRM